MLTAKTTGGWLMVAAMCLGGVLAARAADTLPSGLTRERYLGWEGSLVIESEPAETRLVVVPAIGGRIMRYEMMGDNLLWDNPATYGLNATLTKRALLPGGYQMVVEAPALPAADLERLEFGPHELASARNYAATFASDFASTSLQLSKDILLDADSGELGIVQKAKNISDKELALSLRARTQCKGGGFVLVPLNKHSRFRAGWSLRHIVEGRAVYDSLNPASPQVKNQGGTLVVDTRAQPGRIGLDSDAQWVAYVLDKTMLVQYFPYDFRAKYPQGHTVEVGWTDLITELELLGPEAPLAAGATREAPVKWVMISLKEAVTTAKQAHALARKVPPSPFGAAAK